MKYIKTRSHFLKEALNDNALEILADNDGNQNPVLQDTLDKLDDVSVNKPVVVRLGPSPTGKAHIGFLRTALYNYLFAKQNSGKLILRIEDTDEKRFDPEAEDYIKRALEWVGIEADEDPWKGGPNGPYRQSERDYTKHVKTLLDTGNAYYAFDTEDDINLIKAKDPYFTYNFKTRGKLNNSLNLPRHEVDKLISSGQPFTIRFKVPENVNVSFTDIIRGNVSINSNEIDDKILIKSTGMVSYHMANVCDDHDMGVTHVLRGEEWIASTPFHILLYKAFGWRVPQFAHLPSILKPDGRGKLSKRDGVRLGIPVFPFGGEGVDDKGSTIKYKGFKDEGFEPNAVVNFLLLLGWAPTDGKELYSLAEMISDFSLDRVHKAGARFDMEKAKWFNSVYVQSMKDEELLKHLDIGNDFEYSAEKLSLIVDLCKKRSTFKKDMQVVADIFFKPVSLKQNEKSSLSDDYRVVFTEFIHKAEEIEWDMQSIKQLIFDISAEKNIKMGKIMPSLRVSITGGVPGPDLLTCMFILGKEESLIRIKNSLS
jgi:glutamyl-tRNA synthetase